MNKDVFIERKEGLISLIKDSLVENNVCEQDKGSLNILLGIIDEYSFENRLQKKGLLTHTIVDSLELDYSIGEKFIMFDQIIK